MAVTVVEDKKPRMVVFGDAQFLSNFWLTRMRSAREYYSLFVSSLEWMSDGDVPVGLQPKESTIFVLPQTVNEGRLVLLPGWAMILGIFGLGTGIRRAEVAASGDDRSLAAARRERLR